MDRKGSVFSNTFRKGAVSALLPLLFMSLCLFVFCMGQSLNRLGAANTDMLSKNNQIINYMLEDMSRSMDNLSRDPTVVDFSMNPYRQDLERNTAICALLANLANSYSYVEEGCLFSFYENLRISSSGEIRSGEPAWLPNFLENKSPFHTGAFFQISTFEAGGILFLSVGIPARSAAPAAIAVLQIDLTAFFSEAIYDGLSNKSIDNIYILEEGGGLLFADLKFESIPPDAAALRQKVEGTASGPCLAWMGANLIQYSTLSNPELGWQYVKASPALSENNSLLPLLFPLILCVLTACLIGLLLVYQSSKALYRPLEQLISALPEPISPAPQDEYQRLANYYDDLLNQRDEVYEQVSAIKPLLLKKFLASLLSDRKLEADEILYQAKILEIPFQPTVFAVLLIQIDHYYKLPFSDEEKREIKTQLQALISRSAAPSLYCVSAEATDETLLLVCNLLETAPAEEADRIFRLEAEAVKREIESAWPFTVTIGIGQGRCLGALQASCQEARAALAYKLYQGGGKILSYKDIQPTPRQTFYHDTETVQQLLNSVRTGDLKNTHRLLSNVFSELSNQEKFAPRQVRNILQNLTAAIQDILLSEQLLGETGITEDLEAELSKKRTLSDIENWLVDIYERTASAVRRKGSGKGLQNAVQIKTYIDENLTKDISLASISEHVNYSPTYVSKIFRQHYGMSYIDYLNSQRVKLSQSLLASTELSVKEIGFQVGFNNMQSFFRIFKRYTGLTPLQYRESQRV